MVVGDHPSLQIRGGPPNAIVNSSALVGRDNGVVKVSDSCTEDPKKMESSSLSPWHRSRRFRTILVGTACFALGSVAVVKADVLPPGLIHGIADAKDSTHTVAVNDAR